MDAFTFRLPGRQAEPHCGKALLVGAVPNVSEQQAWYLTQPKFSQSSLLSLSLLIFKCVRHIDKTKDFKGF